MTEEASESSSDTAAEEEEGRVEVVSFLVGVRLTEEGAAERGESVSTRETVRFALVTLLADDLAGGLVVVAVLV